MKRCKLCEKTKHTNKKGLCARCQTEVDTPNPLLTDPRIEVKTTSKLLNGAALALMLKEKNEEA